MARCPAAYADALAAKLASAVGQRRHVEPWLCGRCGQWHGATQPLNRKARRAMRRAADRRARR